MQHPHAIHVTTATSLFMFTRVRLLITSIAHLHSFPLIPLRSFPLIPLHHSTLPRIPSTPYHSRTPPRPYSYKQDAKARVKGCNETHNKDGAI
ncbi:hypothetical protein B0O80DRAFT_466638 [Mortierella sp. GBAus27b]|nr:hypothetical protein B0O80DRAFT_466638 [Mortierella sp. GBAus27b]